MKRDWEYMERLGPTIADKHQACNEKRIIFYRIQKTATLFIFLFATSIYITYITSAK